MRYLFLLYIILNPLFMLPDFDQRMAQEVFFQISSILIFASSFFVKQRDVKFSKLHLWLGIMLVAFVVAWLHSTYGFQKIAFNFILGLMVYMTFIKTMAKDDIKFLFKGVAWVGIIGIIYMSFQFIGVDLRGTTNIGQAGSSVRIDHASFFFQNSAMGMYFAQIIPIIASINIYLAPLFLIPVLKSQCAVALAGGMTACLFFLWFRKRIVFWIALIPVILGVLYFGFNKENYDGFAVRLPVWKEVIQDTFQNPLGQGLDSFANGKCRFVRDVQTKKIYRFYKEGEDYKYYDRADKDFMSKLQNKTANVEFIDHPHSEYLWLGYELGIPAIAILGFIFYYIYDRFRKSMRDPLTCSCVGYLITIAIFSITQFPLHLSRIAHLLPIIGGIFYIATEDS